MSSLPYQWTSLMGRGSVEKCNVIQLAAACEKGTEIVRGGRERVRFSIKRGNQREGKSEYYQ